MPRFREYRWDAWASAARTSFEKDRPQLLAIDTETTGLGFHDHPFGATVTWRNEAGLSSWYFELSQEGPRDILQELLAKSPAWVGHNIKFDLQKLRLVGAIRDIPEIHDTMVQFHLLDENSPKGLKHLAVTQLGYNNVAEVTIKSGKNKGQTKMVPKDEHRLNEIRRKLKLTKDDGYHVLPRRFLVPYALRDTEFTLLLHEKLLWQVEANGVLPWYGTEIEVLRVLLDMEDDGLLCNLPYLDDVVEKYGVMAMTQWQDVVRMTDEPELNLNSPVQLKAAFSARGIHLADTQASTLEALDDELAGLIVQYRETFKMYKTYLKGIQTEAVDGIIHPWINGVGAKTGRTSSGAAKE